MKGNYIVVGICQRLTRQVLLALRGASKKANCIVIGGEQTANLKWSSLCSRNFVVNFDNKDAGNDRLFTILVNALTQKYPNAVLIPADCEGTRVINRVKEQLRVKRIPHADLATLDMLDNKWSFFQFCQAHALSVPETIYVGRKSDTDFSALANRLGLPFVLKPANQAGSSGVHVVRNEEYFNRAIRDNPAYAFDTLIAQQYIDGIDLCFNFFAMDGEVAAFTIQERKGAIIRFLSHPELERLGHRLARAAAYHGVMCIDARVEASTGKVYLIESNPRFWASLGASVWCGINFVLESIQAARRMHGPHTITSGIFHERHPVLRPAAWKSALFDVSERGRILRANLRDLPVVFNVIGSFPSMAWKRVTRRVMTQRLTGI